ncbi:3-hydroxyacyl-ACP dehydratase [Vibrio sp. MA40-2]|uniref:ApeI family dehydratase n=1 Tax=Vibrio sp. MA40-2 TaxID=3391828 RepID=UPI0039A4F4F0
MVRQLPRIQDVQISNNKVVLTLFVQSELEYFKGHFEHFPILPGVVQLDWALHFASMYFNSRFELAGMELVKYQQPITPESEVKLEIEWLQDINKLQFKYLDLHNIYSQGKVKLR